MSHTTRSPRSFGDFHLLLDAIGQPVIAVDMAARVTLFNAAAERLFGRAQEEMVGRDAFDVVPPAHREQARSIFEFVRNGHAWSGRLSIATASGDASPVSVISRPLRDARGMQFGIVTVVWDISRELANEARFRALFESATIGVSIHSPDGMIVEWNPALAQMLGHGPDALPIHVAAVTHPEDMKLEERLMQAVLDGRRDGYQMDKRYLRKDGTIVWGSHSAAVVRDTNGRMLCAFGLVEDITERKQMEKELRDLTARVNSVREEEQARVAREIHDDLGQRLTALKLGLAWLRRKAGEPGPEDLAELVTRKTDDMTALLDDTFQALRTLLQDLRPVVLDDLGLPAAVEWHVGRFAERTGLRCHLDVDLPGLTPHSDRDNACFRILQEALTNVARHAQAQRVWVRLWRDEGLRLAVRDDGVGVEAGALIRPAMGIIGMRERARALGGTVELRRSEIEGTVLTARLPW